ncbi:MAG: PadR family transcriptional regulator [Frankia sp.]
MSAQALPGPWARDHGRRERRAESPRAGRPRATEGSAYDWEAKLGRLWAKATDGDHDRHDHHRHHPGHEQSGPGAHGRHDHGHHPHHHDPGDRGGRGRRGGRSGRGGGPGFGFPGGPGFGSGFGSGFGPGFGRGPKVGRGDVRNALLALLAEEPMHGYQMIRELSERSGGAWRPSPGSVYPVLAMLADEGLVRAVEEASGKRVFHLTDAGKADVAAHADEPKPWDLAADTDTVTDLRSVTFQVGAAVVQVARAGNDSQIAAAHKVLTEARRALYRILAEEDLEPATPTATAPPTEPEA